MPGESARWKRGALFAGLLALAWLCLAANNFHARIFTRIVLSPLAAGGSNFKQYAALLWTAAALIFAALPGSLPGPSWKKRAVLWMCVCVLFSVAEHCMYAAKAGISPVASSAVAVDSHYSGNNLDHLHVSKGMLALLLSLAGQEPFMPYADSGFPYFRLLGGTIFACNLAALAIFYFSLLLALRANFRGGNLSAPLKCVLAAASYAPVRCLVDGGPLSPEFLTGSSLLCALLFYPATGALRAAFIRMIEFVGVGSVMWLFLTREHLLSNLRLALTAALFFASIGSLAAAFRRPAVYSLIAPLVCLASLVAASWNSFIAWEVRRGLTAVETGTPVNYMSVWGPAVDWPVIQKQASVTVHRFAAEGRMRLWDLYRRLGVPPSRAVFDIPGVTCDENATREVSGAIIALEPFNVEAARPPSSVVRNFEIQTCPPGRNCTFCFRADLSPCSGGQDTMVIVRYLGEMGLKKLAWLTRAEDEKPLPCD